ncbi:hypothetical protein KI387_002972, partial [Taxus chinensis]
ERKLDRLVMKKLFEEMLQYEVNEMRNKGKQIKLDTSIDDILSMISGSDECMNESYKESMGWTNMETGEYFHRGKNEIKEDNGDFLEVQQYLNVGPKFDDCQVDIDDSFLQEELRIEALYAGTSHLIGEDAMETWKNSEGQPQVDEVDLVHEEE